MHQQAGLWLTVIILLGINLGLLWRQLKLTPRFYPTKSYVEAVMEKIWEKQLKKDPPLGTEMEELKDFRGTRVVIVIERCTDCIARTLKEWTEAVKWAGLPSLILVTRETEEQVRKVLKQWQIETEVVSDPGGEIAKNYNAFFTPRVYVLRDGRLVWKQEKRLAYVNPWSLVMEITGVSRR